MDIKWVGAHQNNFTKGRQGNNPQYIIIHWIVGTLKSCDATFLNPDRKASAHYGVGNKEVHQYVKEEDTAWHAGNWEINLRSIGIEHEGGPSIPITDQTYQTSGELVAQIAKRYEIPLDRAHIKGHSEVSQSPTACPGSLDIEKVLSIAYQYLTPQPSTIQDPALSPEQAKRFYQVIAEREPESEAVIKSRHALELLNGLALEKGSLKDLIASLKIDIGSKGVEVEGIKLALDKVKKEYSEFLVKHEEQIASLMRERDQAILKLADCQNNSPKIEDKPKDAPKSPDSSSTLINLLLSLTPLFDRLFKKGTQTNGDNSR